MFCKIVRQLCIGAALCSALAFSMGSAAAETQFRISVDTGPLHFRNHMLNKFTEELSRRTDGALKGKLIENGTLYVSRDEPQAVAAGKVEMTVTYNPSLSPFVSNMNLLDLPIFSGSSPDAVNALVDGEVGQALTKGIEDKLGLVVPGHWLILGFVSTFGAGDPIRSFDDLEGRRIRVPGGEAMISRYKALGAEAVSVPLTEVSEALKQGKIDGLVSTSESVRSIDLAREGISSVLNDQLSVYYYVPLVNADFWNSLSDGQKAVFTEIWNELVADARNDAIRRQKEAMAENEQNGIVIFEPSAEELAKLNARLQPFVDQMARDLGVDEELVEAARDALTQ